MLLYFILIIYYYYDYYFNLYLNEIYDLSFYRVTSYLGVKFYICTSHYIYLLHIDILYVNILNLYT